MKFRKITAIVRLERAELIEQRLKAISVPGVSCSHVRGYGEYADFYSSDWQVTHARFEIFAAAARAQEIVDAILEEARTGVSGDGIVAVLPVEHLYHIRSGEESAESGT